MALQFLNDGYFTSKVGIGTNSPDAKLHVEGGIGIFNVSDDWQQSSLGTYLFRGANFATTISNETSTLKIFPATSSKAVGNYWGGINFMHLDPENSSWGTAFTGSQFWIGGRITSLPGQELSALVFATNSSSTAGSSPTEKMVILPNGDVGIGTIDPDEKLDVAGKVQVTGTSLTVLNASDPIIQVSDTDTNYKGAMRWLSSDNVLEFYTRYAGTYYTSNLVLDRGSVGIGTNSPNALLEVDSITYSANNAIANFVNGNNPVRVAYDTVVIAQTDVPCLSIVETIDGSQANEQKLSFSVGDNKAIIRSSATAISGLYINVAGTNDAPGYNTADGLNAIRVLNNGDSIFNYKVGIGTTNPNAKLEVQGTNTAGDLALSNSSTTVSSGDTLGKLAFRNYDGSINFSTFSGEVASIRAVAAVDFTGTNGANTDLLFYTNSVSPANGSPVSGGSEKMRILANGNVGIDTTTPQSKLQVAGGIQMADDTATASASKVGTMRYRTGTEYVEVTGTEIVTNGDFATDTGWTKGTGWTISEGTADAATATSDFTQTVSFTLGQTYRLTYTVSNYSAGAVRTSLGAYVANTPISANGNYTDIFTPTNVSSNSLLYFEGQSGFTGSIDNVSMVEVTSEDASYADMCMQTGASTYEWINIVRNTY